MRLSLLKSAEYPDPSADKGLHQFTYSIYTHTGSWHESDLIPLAWDLNDPLAAVEGKFNFSDIIKINSGRENPGLTARQKKQSPPCAALDAIKKSEDGKDIILRLHEIHGGRGKLNIEFTVPVSGYWETNLMEEPVGKYKPGRVIKRNILPFEIVTFRVKL